MSIRGRLPLDNIDPKGAARLQQSRQLADIFSEKVKSITNNPKSRATTVFKNQDKKLNSTALVVQQESNLNDSRLTNVEERAKESEYPRLMRDVTRISNKLKNTGKDEGGISSNLPPINPSKDILTTKKYYIDTLSRALNTYSNMYLLKIFREHFIEVTRGLQISKGFKVQNPKKLPALPRTTNFKKTIILDLDETLIHCNERLAQSTVRLPIPVENGITVMAGVNVRPFCRQFLKQLSSIAEVIIFTASNSLYADTVLNYLDHEKKWISHRLYRQHCTQEKGFFLKDLRGVNRRLEDMVIVDNSVFSYCLHMENGVPIIPFYDNKKDVELRDLLQYLRELISHEDMRVPNGQYFMVNKLTESRDPKTAMLKALTA